jgi:hypothetical protein
LVLEEAARDAQVKPRSQAEEFIVKIAKEVEATMQREIVPLPQGTTIIPTEYTIFLSEEDDKEWQGVKRRGLEQGLYHILAERAKEIAGKRKFAFNTVGKKAQTIKQTFFLVLNRRSRLNKRMKPLRPPRRISYLINQSVRHNPH